MSRPLSPAARAPRHRGARALFTGRDGGVSTGDHASLNLARHVGDDEAAVERNRALLAVEMGAPLVFVDQVHSADVHVLPSSGEVPVLTADALVTDRRDVALAIMVADCLPVLLSDPEAGVVAVAHAGRQGLLGGVLQNTVQAMQGRGARPERLEVSIGPSICGACYEVPESMREETAAQLPAARATTSWGTPALDLRAGAVAVLDAAGVPREAIAAEAPCTLEDERFFSYRRSSRTGRFAGVLRRE
ncbi:peptidoglycan editing factor PgeF [Brachybacterium saurashtrense]|uniref:Purine nucleoside phosphorylase n=1 Tax=Brachybacterium saurashtrense TaxID=556288 RepID=A0A345YL38_9MICO|nr:peptidoglycan editing factor PgeF [Brachybacterium saurashtrense]AXK44640.1 peptidoglycan editing factor PgeF [Brachybacterium saurashtrense]RRR23252.1 peptidoglycan editing factor PgeF [Brachybacterium saurashtrense]